MTEKYCRECGSALTMKELEGEGTVPYCEKCGQFRFPMYNVAVSMIVVNRQNGKIILIKQYGRDDYILVAGYVNPGECAEDAVRREIREETGMETASIRFNRTRFFEPSNTLMCNFTAYVEDDHALNVNREIDSFSWFTPEEARENIKKNSLAQYFLNAFLDEPEV